MPGQVPSFVRESLWQIPDACTLMRTCARPGSGTSRSTIWKAPLALGTWAARILGMNPPQSPTPILVGLGPRLGHSQALRDALLDAGADLAQDRSRQHTGRRIDPRAVEVHQVEPGVGGVGEGGEVEAGPEVVAPGGLLLG